MNYLEICCYSRNYGGIYCPPSSNSVRTKQWRQNGHKLQQW